MAEMIFNKKQRKVMPNLVDYPQCYATFHWRLSAASLPVSPSPHLNTPIENKLALRWLTKNDQCIAVLNGFAIGVQLFHDFIQRNRHDHVITQHMQALTSRVSCLSIAGIGLTRIAILKNHAWFTRSIALLPCPLPRGVDGFSIGSNDNLLLSPVDIELL